MSDINFGFTADQIVSEGRTTKEDIALLRAWLAAQNLPRLTDEQIVLFLLSCRNKQEPARTTIASFYTVRKGAPELFDNRRVLGEDLALQLKTLEMCVLPERTDDGSAILYCRLLDTCYSNFEFSPSLKLLFMTLDAAVHDYPPNALYILYDMKGVGLMHLTKVRIGLLRTYFRYLQESLPLRLKKMHVLNTVGFIDKVLLLIKPFVKKNVMDMVHFHPTDMDMKLFHKNWLPKRCLPEDLGGDLPPVRVLHQNNIQKLKDMEPHFVAEEMQRRA